VEIQLEQVRRQPFSWKEIVSVPAGALERPEIQALGGIAWEGRVAFVDPGFLLAAELSYEQTLACTRCLAPIVQPVESRVELLILIEPKAAAAPPAGRGRRGERELSEEELGVATLREPILETDPILLEQLQLNIPMVALCRSDCAGLCPQCGVNRNLEPCACRETPADPRWEALAGLRARLRND
jgi:uncharacterized protein